MEIKLLTPNESDKFVDVINLFAEIFEMEPFRLPNENHLKSLLVNKNFMVVAAFSDGKLVGGMTVYILEQYYSTKPLAYIYDLAVATEHQRKGIGKNMISFINRRCKNKGYEEVFVQADKEDDYALDFYRKTNPTKEEDVSHFYYLLNK